MKLSLPLRYATFAFLPFLSACAGSPMATDGAIGTLPVPAEGDCQIRRFEGHGTGRFVSATGSIVVVTVIGAERCAELIDKMDGLLK